MFRPIRLLRYGVAIGSVALALVLTLLLKPLLAPTLLTLFFLAVTFSTWYGGRGAGFVATIFSVFATRYFLIPPIHSWLPISSAAIIELIVFSLVTILVSWLETNLRIVHRWNREHLNDLQQTELALRESDARFHAAADSSFDAIYILKSVRDRTGEIIDFQFVDLNEHGAKLLSLTKAEVLGQNLCELLPVNRTEGFFDKYKQVVETKIPLVEEFSSQALPGVTAAWLHHQVVPLADGIAITTRDITERKQAEEALRASEALYRTLAEAMPQLVWTQTVDGQVDYVNRPWQEALGVTLEEVSRDGWAHLVHPDDLPQLLAKQAVSMQESEIRIAEFRYRMADGRYRWFLGRCVPVKDDRGQVIKWVGTSTDIHDLKRYEQELARRKQQFQTLAENSPDIIARIDRQLRHIYINAAITKATGLSPADLIGKTHDDLDLPDDLRCDWQERLRSVFTTGQPCSYEFTFLAPDGMRQYFARLVPELAPNGTVESVLAITSDISDRKRIEKERDRLLQLERAARAEAEAANRVKDEFLMVLSHELRTPLNPILGWTKLLKTRQFAPGMVAHALDTIERNARQQSQLVEDLLDVSRILQGKLALNCCPVHLAEVIEVAISSLQLSAQAKSIVIATDLDPTVPPVLGNQERLQQIVWNLVGNAVKFTPHQGRVEVSLRAVGKSAQIRVIDTGKGIEPSFMPYVFDYFRQADGTTTRSYGGLGLGLAIARHLVELHGGTIEVASEGLGKGAIFTLELPIPPENLASDLHHSTEAKAATILQQQRILLAGHKDDTQELMVVVLEQAGAVVVTATSIESVLEELARSQPNVLIGAIELLRQNDYELLERLRLWFQEFGEQIPVIALAPYVDEVDPQEALAKGLPHVLPSSIEPDELVAAIAGFIVGESLSSCG